MLEPIVVNLREHVYGCALCQAKGFICEICMNEKDIIFPFEFEITNVCSGKSSQSDARRRPTHSHSSSVSVMLPPSLSREPKIPVSEVSTQ